MKSILIILFFPVVAFAQMQQPFRPIGVTSVSIDPAKPSVIPATFVYQGKDSTGADVYAEQEVDVPNNDVAAANDAIVAQPGNSDIAATFNRAGFSVNPSAPIGQRVVGYGSYFPSGMGICRRQSTTGYVNTGTQLGGGPVAFGTCYGLLAAFYGAGWDQQPVKSIRAGDCYSYTVWYDGTTTIYTRGSWTPSVSQCNDEPAYPISAPISITGEQSRELLMNPQPEPGVRKLPQTPSIPETKQQFERVIINNYSMSSTVVNRGTTITNNYNASPSSVTTTTTKPTTIGTPTAQTQEAFCSKNPNSTECTDAATLADLINDGNIDIKEYCEESPDALICIDIDGLSPDPDFSVFQEDAGTLTTVESVLASYAPSISLPAASCPALPSIVFTPLNVDINPNDFFDFCEFIESFLRPAVLVVGYLASIRLLITAV